MGSAPTVQSVFHGGPVEAGAILITTNATLFTGSSSFSGPVTIQDGGRLSLSAGGTVTFQTNVWIQSGGLLDTPVSVTLALSGTPPSSGATWSWSTPVRSQATSCSRSAPQRR